MVDNIFLCKVDMHIQSELYQATRRLYQLHWCHQEDKGAYIEKGQDETMKENTYMYFFHYFILYVHIYAQNLGFLIVHIQLMSASWAVHTLG
jgi:hypothetical protein